jgi:hypothetical protein
MTKWMREGLLGISWFESSISRKVVAPYAGRIYMKLCFAANADGTTSLVKPSGDRVRIPLHSDVPRHISMQDVSSLLSLRLFSCVSYTYRV